MLILISPAKTLDYQSPLTTTRYTLPELLDNSQQLIHEARKLTPPQINGSPMAESRLGGLDIRGLWCNRFRSIPSGHRLFDTCGTCGIARQIQ